MNDGSLEVEDLPSDLSESDEEDEEEEEEEEEEESEESGQRKRERCAALDAKRAAHDAKRRKVARYEEYNYYSRPASFQVHSLVCELDRVSNDLVWLSVVGVTDAYLRGHINNAAYAVCYSELATKVVSLNVEGDGSVGSVERSCEPRFLLHRFWSLYESMVNSEYVVVKLGLLRKDSRRLCGVRGRRGARARAAGEAGHLAAREQGAVGTRVG